MYRNSANVPQFRNYSAIELRYFAELQNICGIADNCGLRNCGYLGLKIRNVLQYRKSQLFRNCLFAAPSLVGDLGIKVEYFNKPVKLLNTAAELVAKDLYRLLQYSDRLPDNPPSRDNLIFKHSEDYRNRL